MIVTTPTVCPAFATPLLAALMLPLVLSAGEPAVRAYHNRIAPVASPRPILADYPQYVQPIETTARSAAPPLIVDEGANLAVDSWRFSYNVRGVVEVPHRLDGNKTAVIVVHPWGIDDSYGWKTPEPAGAAFFCTPAKNRLFHEHARTVVDPLLERLRDDVKFVMFSLPGSEDAIRKQVYRSIRSKPTAADREVGKRQLAAKLAAFDYRGQPVPTTLDVHAQTPTVDYFARFPGLVADADRNGAGFWDLPIPVADSISVHDDDIVIYDADGYDLLRDFLRTQGIEHVLLAGYATDMCVCATTAGYDNLRQDFDVLLVGDATLATFPANDSPAYATNAALSLASLKVFVTQVSWIDVLPKGAD